MNHILGNPYAAAMAKAGDVDWLLRAIGIFISRHAIIQLCMPPYSRPEHDKSYAKLFLFGGGLDMKLGR